MSWVNWSDFVSANAPEMQRRTEEQERLSAQQQAAMDKALASLDSVALNRSRQGTYGGLQGLDGYSDLMAQRDAALQQSPVRQQVAPWESDMGGPGDFESPWASLNKRLGQMNQSQSEINTRTQNQQAWDKQQADIRAFQAEQEKKRHEAMYGQRDRDTRAYATWSDAVNRSAERGGGIGAGAYYDAAQGYGPQPVRGQQSPHRRLMTGRLRDNEKNQIMPPTTNSGFGQSTSGF